MSNEEFKVGTAEELFMKVGAADALIYARKLELALQEARAEQAGKQAPDAFEQWFKHEFPDDALHHYFNGSYQGITAHYAWQGWKAALCNAAPPDLQRQLEEKERECEELRAKLAEFQQSEFHPDWSLLQATQESLREYMRLTRELQEKLAEAQKVTVVDDLSALVLRLARALRKEDVNSDLPNHAVDYLRQHGLINTVMRATTKPEDKP
jgi:hypothetical protein